MVAAARLPAAELLAGVAAAIAYTAITAEPDDTAAPSTDSAPVPVQATDSRADHLSLEERR